MISHLILILAFLISMFLPECDPNETCYQEFAPLLFIGVGYSIFIIMFFASIPLLVEQKNVGTAYGICMIFPNIALLYGPWQVNQIIQMSQDENGSIEWLSDNLFYIGINGLGFLMAIFLYCWDMYKSEGVLNWPVYYDYGDDEYGEEEEAEVEGDVQGDNKSSYDMKSQMRN